MDTVVTIITIAFNDDYTGYYAQVFLETISINQLNKFIICYYIKMRTIRITSVCQNWVNYQTKQFYIFCQAVTMKTKNKYHSVGGEGKAMEYYNFNKKRPQEQSLDYHRNLSEEKEKKRQQIRNRYKNMSDENKTNKKKYFRN